jgi:hypothetical protein
VVDGYANQTNIVSGFNATGQAAQFIDIPEEDLGIARSAKGWEGMGEGTAIPVLVPEPTDPYANQPDNEFVGYSSPLLAHTFDPYAKFIDIDTRLNNEVETLLRPHGSLMNVYREYGGIRIRNPADDACYVSGGFVRRVYDVARQTMVSYYFDHNECRWIKNTQKLPANIPATIGQYNPGSGTIMVFRWIERGRQTSNMV